MKISFAEPKLPKSGTLVVGVLEGKKLTVSAAALDKESNGALTSAITASRFTGKKEETLAVPAPRGLFFERLKCFMRNALTPCRKIKTRKKLGRIGDATRKRF